MVVAVRAVVVVVVEAAVRGQLWLVVVVVAVRDSETSGGCIGSSGSENILVPGVSDGGTVVGLIEVNSDSDCSNSGEDDQWYG